MRKDTQNISQRTMFVGVVASVINVLGGVDNGVPQLPPTQSESFDKQNIDVETYPTTTILIVPGSAVNW